MTTETATQIHGYTPPTSDCRTWLEKRYPEGDVSIAHTDSCDQDSMGDECEGGCPVVNCNS